MKTLDEVNCKMFDSWIDWRSIDKKLALRNTAALDLVREACLVESYLPVYTGKMNQLFWENIEATSAFSIEAYEAYGHYFVLRRYLEIVGYNQVSDQEIIALRNKDRDKVYTNKVQELINFMGTEYFAAEFFHDLITLTEEPVLKKILARFSKEEVSHANFAFDLLEGMIKKEPGLKEEAMKYALGYRHVGSYVLSKISPAKEDNIKIIHEFNKKIENLVGKRISDALAEKNEK